jgi:hypothetical protein
MTSIASIQKLQKIVQKPAVQKAQRTSSGLKIINAQSPIMFRVTEEAIKRSRCKDPEHCVIAEALREHFGDIFETVQSRSAPT